MRFMEYGFVSTTKREEIAFDFARMQTYASLLLPDFIRRANPFARRQIKFGILMKFVIGKGIRRAHTHEVMRANLNKPEGPGLMMPINFITREEACGWPPGILDGVKLTQTGGRLSVVYRAIDFMF